MSTAWSWRSFRGFVQLFVEVDDVAAFVAKVEQLGGRT